MKKRIWIPLGIFAGAILLFGLIMATAPYWGKAAQQEESAAADQLVEKEETPAPDLPKKPEKEEIYNPEQPEKEEKPISGQLEEPNQEEDIKGDYDSKYDSPDDTLPPKSETPITKEQAIAIARAQGVIRYGKAFELYRFQDHISNESKKHSVSFCCYIGEENYILASTIDFNITEYGELESCRRTGWEEYLEFDHDLLKTFSKKDVEAFAERKMQEQYGNESSYEIKNISVSLKQDYENDKFYLDVYLSIHVQPQTQNSKPGAVIMPYATTCSLRYDFPQ